MKIITIVILGLLILSLVVGLSIYSNQREVIYDFEGVKINKNNFDTIYEAFGSSRFTLCNLEENKCVRMDLARLEEDG